MKHVHVRNALLGLLLLVVSGTAQASDQHPRAREAGIRVGHVTLIEGSNVRTGVTAILPHGGNLYQEKVPAGFAVGNAYGKFMGSTQVKELGELETPILLTNT